MRCDRAIEHAIAALPDDTLIAFSGGGDSTALLAACVARGLRHAAIVDHRIQPQSRLAADEACAAAEKLGADCTIHTLSWSQGPPKDHARARRARYAALAQVARARGLTHIAAAHTRDDQAETILIRHCAQSGLRGLAGMHARAPYPVWPEGRGLSLLRPLLRLSRAELRAWLEVRGVPWREDPANDDRRFARVRARIVLQANPCLSARLLQVGASAAHRAACIDAAALALADQYVAFDDMGAARMGRAPWRAASLLVRRRVLSVLVQAVSGKEAPAEAPALNALADRIDAVPRGAASLGGAHLTWTAQTLALTIDPGLAGGRRDHGIAAPAPAPLPRGESAVWQGRLEVSAGSMAPNGLALGPGVRGALLVCSGDAAFTLADAKAAGLIQSWRSLPPQRLQTLLYRGKFTSA